MKAKLRGAGAIAQGDRAVAAGKVAIGGDVYGDVVVGRARRENSAARELRTAYLSRVMERYGYVSLAGIDASVAGQREADARLSLNAVYTALLTRSPREQDALSGKARPVSRDPGTFLSALEQLDRHQKLVLLGDPGSGKSTFVNFVALCLAGEALRNREVNLKRLRAPLPDPEGKDTETPQRWTHQALLPVPLVLRDFAAIGLPPRGKPASAEHLWEFIENELKEAARQDYARYLKRALQKSGVLLLLDGLDEVPEAEQRREQVKQAVEDFVESFPHCRVLVTSRTYAYQNQGWRLQGFEEALLAPFSDGQMDRSGALSRAGTITWRASDGSAWRTPRGERCCWSRPSSAGRPCMTWPNGPCSSP
jgi:hypothetical protein